MPFPIARLCAAAVLATAVAAVSGCGNDAATDSPQTATRDFLEIAAVQGDGVAACNYLTDAARQEVARASASPGITCREALDNAVVDGTSGPVSTDAAVKRLPMVVRQDGRRATVTVTTGDGPRVLHLLNLGAAAGNEFAAPATAWRISSGVAGLVDPRVFHGRSAQVAQTVGRLQQALRDGDVELLCRPGALLTPAVVDTLGGAGGGDSAGQSCESTMEILISKLPSSALRTRTIALRHDLALARVQRRAGPLVALTLLRDGRRWLVSFTNGVVPFDALVQS